jgi:hypothetical protein
MTSTLSTRSVSLPSLYFREPYHSSSPSTRKGNSLPATYCHVTYLPSAPPSLTASDWKAALRNQLNELMMDCCRDDWNGYGATALTNSAYQAALQFIDSLPEGFQTPELGADPEGCVTFEWRRSSTRTVWVSVGTNFEIHYAALLSPGNEHHGKGVFFNALPDILLNLVRQLYRF